MKKYVGKLREINGEFEYIHNHLFETDDNPRDYIENYAAGFYGDDGVPFDNAYEFFGGGVLIYVYSVEEVTDADYAVLNKYV